MPVEPGVLGLGLRDKFLDAAPEECRAKLQEMGIDPDYFLAVAPDLPDEQLDQIRATLRQLTGRL